MELTEDEYFENLLGKECNAKRKFKTGGCGKNECGEACQKIGRALREAHDIRKFEIELSWKRAIYFWGFEVAIFATYAVVFKNDSKNITEALPLFLLLLLGLFITGMFHLVARGSKAWQKNWEKHIDMLEDDITGQLHKIVFRSEDFFSPSRINLYTIRAIGIFWCLLFLLNLRVWMEINIFILILIPIGLFGLYFIFGKFLESSLEKEKLFNTIKNRLFMSFKMLLKKGLFISFKILLWSNKKEKANPFYIIRERPKEKKTLFILFRDFLQEDKKKKKKEDKKKKKTCFMLFKEFLQEEVCDKN